MTTHISKQIDALPPLPESVIQINKLKSTGEYGIKELLLIISKDPNTVSNILKVARGALYGIPKFLTDDIKNIGKVATLLGCQTIERIAIGTIVQSLLKPNLSPYGINTEIFSQISGIQSRIIELWGEEKIKNLKKDLLLSSFLQEIGKIVISMVLDDIKLSEEFNSKLAEVGSIDETERLFLGETSATISAMVFEKWNFEGDMVNLIKFSDDPKNAPVELICGSYALKIVKILCPVSSDRFTDEAREQALALADECGFNVGSLEKVIDRISGMVEDTLN